MYTNTGSHTKLHAVHTYREPHTIICKRTHPERHSHAPTQRFIHKQNTTHANKKKNPNKNNNKRQQESPQKETQKQIHTHTATHTHAHTPMHSPRVHVIN